MQIFQALGDENRWKILVAVAEVGELPCRDLDDLLSVSKATISYHARLLTQAGLITVRKQGRNSFYALDVEGYGMPWTSWISLRVATARQSWGNRRIDSKTPDRARLMSQLH